MQDSGDNKPSQKVVSRGEASAYSVLAWHGLWLATMGLGVGAMLFELALPTSTSLVALALGAAPALAGMLLARTQHSASQNLILFNWAAGAVLAGFLSGGLAGPLGVWHLAPLAAAAAMTRVDRLAMGAAFSLAACGISLLSGAALSLPAPPAYDLAAWMGGIAVATSALGLGTALVMLQRQVILESRRRTLLEMRLREALGDQPHLLLNLQATGRLAAAWGPPPRGLKGQVRVDQPVWMLASAPDRPAVEAAYRLAASEGFAEVGFAPIGAPTLWTEMTLRRVNPARLSATVRDAGRQRAREADLEHARQEAETQNASKSRFLANMSHELRTPLNAIMGFSDIMRQGLFGPLPDKYAEYSELIHESGNHLLELINDVLDMSKIEAERYDLHRESFDARDAVSAVLRLMRGQADRAGVSLRGLLPREPLEVLADRRAIKQIALNLVSNALKFTPRSGTITVTAQDSDRVFELVVADSGTGISPADLARLGRPFEQAGEVDQRVGGTGLGLSLVRAFAQLHGGEMTIESQLGEGTTVTVRMPVMEPQPHPAPETVA